MSVVRVLVLPVVNEEIPVSKYLALSRAPIKFGDIENRCNYPQTVPNASANSHDVGCLAAFLSFGIGVNVFRGSHRSGPKNMS